MKSSKQSSEATSQRIAELVRADTALMSFRDAGYSFTDAVGETVDNSIQAGAKNIRIGITSTSEKKGKKNVSIIESFAIADDGIGISPAILANTLTIGFSTRYGNRNGIGRYGVGFKLASISQCKRLEVYTKPLYLNTEKAIDSDGNAYWINKEENTQERIFMTYLDLNQIQLGSQIEYRIEEVNSFPIEYASLMANNKSGTLIIWQDLDRFNEKRSYGDLADEKIAQLASFLRRTYRFYIDGGLNIYLPNQPDPLFLYDPAFLLENPAAEKLAPKGSMVGKVIEQDAFEIDGQEVRLRVTLTPEITRQFEGGGGVEGPNGKEQFKPLNIRENKGKISFLRYDREISYTIVPGLLPSSSDPKANLDRHISIDVWFPPTLDEYFQVRHIKRGVEPITKLRETLRQKLEKPVKAARKEIREVWAKNKAEHINASGNIDDVSGGRGAAEEIAQAASSRLPKGRAGSNVTLDEEQKHLKTAAVDAGLESRELQESFAAKAKQQDIVAIETEWPGNSLIDITHLNHSAIVRINRRHPFIKNIYIPLKAMAAAASENEEIQQEELLSLLQKAATAIDLLFFAYAKAENQHQNPEEAFLELREDWGKFTSTYLRKLNDVEIA